MTLTTSYKFIAPLIVLLASAMPLGTPAFADEPDPRVISLSATGTVETTADKVEISTTIANEGDTAAAALDNNTQAMSKIVDGLKAAGIKPEDIQTTKFSITPIYGQGKKRQAAFITHYRINNIVHVTLRDTTKLGNILDDMVALGVYRIGPISFDISDRESLEDEARKLAMHNVIANAKLYAKAAGVELGPVLGITEDGGCCSTTSVPVGNSKKIGKAAPLEAGRANIQIRVKVIWELK